MPPRRPSSHWWNALCARPVRRGCSIWAATRAATRRLAARCGAEVVAVDSDHDAVEVLYRGLRAEPAAITPLVVDLCNPSPAIGGMNRERASWLQRASADCVLALALLHHLMIAGNLSLEGACELFAALTRRDLVLEFVPPDDEQFRRLMRFRVDLFGGLTLESCLEVFGRRFDLVAREPVPGTGRTLLFLRARNTATAEFVGQIPGR